MDDFAISISVSGSGQHPDSDFLDAAQQRSIAHRDSFLRQHPDYGLKTEGPGYVSFSGGGTEPEFPAIW